MNSELPPEDQASILLVDDRPENLALLEAILTPQGYELVKAGSGREALEYLMKQDFAAIVLDVMMPGMDGFETAQLIRQRPRSEHTPIVFLTALADGEREILKGYALGAVDYLIKPFSHEILRAKVAVFVELYRTRQALARQLLAVNNLNLELQDSERKFRLAFENAQDAILWADPETGLLVNCNQAAAELFETTREGLIGRHHTTLHPPEKAAYYREGFQKATALEDKTHEVEIITASGRIRYATVATSLTELAGKPVAQGIFRDISQRKWLEEELKASHDRLQHLLIASPATIYSCLPSGTYPVTFMSANVKALVGFEVREFLDDPELWVKRLHPEDAPGILAKMARLLEEGQQTLEYRFRHSNGNYLWMRDALRLVRDQAGQPLEIVGSWLDITVGKQAEQDRERLAAILETTPDFVGYADAGDTHIIYINPAGRRMIGISPDEDVTRLKIADVHPAWENQLIAEVIMPAAAREGVWTGECAFLSRDGREIPVLMALLAHRDARGEIEVFYTISRDITEFERAEEEARAAARRWQTSFNSLADAMCLQDAQGTIIQVNKSMAQWLGKAPEQMIGQFCCDLVHPGLSSMPNCPLIRMRETRGRESQIFIYAGRWIEETLDPVLGPDGAIVGAVQLFKDITEHKMLEDRLAQAARLNQFFATEPDEAKVYHQALETVLQAVDSPLGYINYVNNEGDLVSPALTREIWEKCQVPDKRLVFPRSHWRGFWGESLLEKKTAVSNTPLQPPAGHLPLQRAVCVPIIYQEELIGQIAVANKGRDYYPEDVELLEEMAGTLAPLMHHRLAQDRLHRQVEEMNRALQEKNADLTNLSHQVSLVNDITGLLNSASDLQTMLGYLASKLVQVIPLDSLNIALLDFSGENRVVTLFTGKKARGIDCSYPLDKPLALAAGLATGQPFHRDDAALGDLPEDRAALKQGLRSYLQFPLISGGALKGVLSLGSKKPHQYREEHLDFLSLLSEQLILIIEKFRNLEAINRNAAELEEMSRIYLEQAEQVVTLNQIIARLSKAQGVKEVCKLISDALGEDLGVDKSLFFLKDTSGEVRLVEAMGLADAAGESLARRFREQRLLFGKAIDAGMIMRRPDLNLPTCLDDYLGHWLILPLKGKRGVLGLVVLEDPGPEKLDELGILLNQAAVLLENAILYEERLLINEQLTEANQRLEQLDQRKTDFLNTVAHDLRTPLTSIKSYADLLIMYPDEDREVQEEFLGVISRETVRLETLINDYLDLARIEAGNLKYTDAPFSLEVLIQHLISVYRGETTRRQIDLEALMEPALPQVVGDQGRYSQVISNLLSNAVKFTPEGGNIKIAARQADIIEEGQSRPGIEVSVQDSGPGIDPRNHKLIFDKFGQVEERTTKAKGGTGLGLAICQDIVRHYGGRLWVESELGKGSRFVFTLPVNPASRQQTEM